MKERKRKNIIMVIIAILFIAIAFLAGFMFYNAPANRLSRQLDLGNKYLEEQNYEQAIVEFDKAIAIDPMNERAYIGKAEGYVGMGDYEQAAATYATAVQTIPDGNEVWNAAEQFYLDYAQIYIDDGDYEQAIDILEEGDALLDSDRLKSKLKEVQAQQEEQTGQQATEQLEARVQEFLQQIYELMAAGNYADVTTMFYSFFTLEESQDILLSYEKYFYFPDESAAQTGMGIGLYVSPPEIEGAQYEWHVYYGNYANGRREGNGVYLLMSGSNVESVFTCEWSDDAPNGYGEWTEQWHDGGMERRMIGNFKDGLLDGEGYFYFKDDRALMVEYEFTFSAAEGIPEDRTEEYFNFVMEILRSHGSITSREEEENIFYQAKSEETYVVAYDEDEESAHIYAYFCLFMEPGRTIGIRGFADVDIMNPSSNTYSVVS